MNPARDMPCPPADADIPAPRHRDRRGGPVHKQISVAIETTTPILGGAPETRSIDEVDFIRVPTIRGHLRFWWRALQTGEITTPEALYQEEGRLWGTAAGNDGIGRSLVEISVRLTDRKSIDETDIELTAGDSYGLWPARAPRQAGVRTGPPAYRRKPGVRFQLSLRIGSSDSRDIAQVRDALGAWILFGGYGSRTRRGVGSLTVTKDDRTGQVWLPSADPDEDETASLPRSLHQLFGRDLFLANPPATTFPRLSGATLLVGAHERNADDAWHKALGWLRQFRQEPVGRTPRAARGLPPGQSRWPEPDKLRILVNKTSHTLRYSDPTMAWPRADFGLPIVGRFHPKDRNDPDPFTLTWHDGKHDTKELRERRMASPVIVKAMPTLQGFRPCVLWLGRTHPPGEVVAVASNSGTIIPRSGAPFGFVGTPADNVVATGLRSPLAGHASVKDAFLAWVKTQGAVQVTP